MTVSAIITNPQVDPVFYRPSSLNSGTSGGPKESLTDITGKVFDRFVETAAVKNQFATTMFQGTDQHDVYTWKRNGLRCLFSTYLVPENSRILVLTRPKPAISLTEREYEVCVMLAEGKTTQVIADELGLDETTVDEHLNSSMTKCDSKTEAQLGTLFA